MPHFERIGYSLDIETQDLKARSRPENGLPLSLSKSGLPGKSSGRPQSIKIHKGSKQEEREMR